MIYQWKQEWDEFVTKAINELGNNLLTVKPSDFIYFSNMPFNSLTKDQLIGFYITMIRAMARRESGFNPNATYTESFKDANAKNVISRGLMQLSFESVKGYGFKLNKPEDLHDPETNLRAAVVIMNKWIGKDGCISDLNHRGAARYWSVIRVGANHFKGEIAAATLFYTSRLLISKTETAPTKKSRLALIVGHDKREKGAFSKTLNASEYEWNSDLARIAKNYAIKSGIYCEVFMRDGVGIQGAVKNALAWKPDCIIEIHFNSFNGKASGTETLYSDSADDKGTREVVFAKMVNDAMVEVLGLPNRGIKKLDGGGRGYGNLSVTKTIPSILIETGFGDNPKDAKAMEKNKVALAKSIVNAFKNFKEV